MSRRARPLAVWTTALLLTAAGTAHAADAAAPAGTGLNIRRSGPAGVATFVTPGAGSAFIPVATPRNRNRLTGLAFFDQYGSLFGVTDPVAQLSAESVRVDQIGRVHTTYQQYHQGVPVFTGVLKLHQDARGRVTAANGRFYPIKPTLGVKPSIDEAGAINAARRSVLVKCTPIVEDSQLLVVDPGWYGDAATGARLAYLITLTDIQAGGGYRESFFVDAHTGEVIDHWSLMEQLLTRDVFDGQQQGSVPGTMARAEGAAAVADADINMAYDFAGDFYDYFQRAFGRDSIDNSGFTLTLTANSRSTGCPNAYWNGFQSVYCTGVVTDDIVAHELTHGLTGNTAKLIYQNQSGQLNESYSDVFGELVDLFNGDASELGTPGSGPAPHWPNISSSGCGTDGPNNLRTSCSPRPSHPDGVRWCIGEDSAAFSGAIREMYDPTCRNDPDKASSPFMLCQSADAGGVHHGSGIPNKAFAMLVDGGSFNGHTIIGIGAIKAGAIWYRALTVYLTPASDFKDAYDAMIQAGNDLVGTAPNDPRTGLPSASTITAFDVQQLTESLQAVEMNTDGACGQAYNVLDEATALESSSPTVLFADGFENGAVGWTVSNSAPPVPYDWTLTGTPLPWSRPGTAYFCEDRAIGDCLGDDETATHTLTSPAIVVPAGVGKVMLGFTHTLVSEGRYDGGRLELSVAGGPWTPIPRTAFEFNPYNNRLVTSALGNSNPLAGGDAFSGGGGRWGRSLVNLSSLGVAASSIQLRWVFGKDGCGGGGGWYIDDVSVYAEPDCDSDGKADVDQFIFRTSSATQMDFGWQYAKTITLTAPPQAAGPVTLGFLAEGDFAGEEEYFDVYVNNVLAGRVFQVGGIDCGATAMRGALSVPAATWNPAAATGTVSILLTATPFVTTFQCNGTWVAMTTQYALSAPDINSDGVLDSCGCPIVTQQPTPSALSVVVGSGASFTAGAIGQATLGYQWRLGGVNLVDGTSAGGGTVSGATSSTLNIAGPGFADAGSYDVVITNGCGSATTSAATLAVTPACPTISTQPQPITVNAGSNALFTVTAAGTAPFSYQWRLGGAPLADGAAPGGGTISGATTDTLHINPAALADAGDYDVLVTNACGTTPSVSATLTVHSICAPDFNDSGTVSVQDIFDFLAGYFANVPRADFNNSSVISVQDIFDFLAAYFAGC